MQSICHLRMTYLCKCNNNTTWKNVEITSSYKETPSATNLLIPFCLNTPRLVLDIHIYIYVRVYVQLKWYIPVRKCRHFLSLSTWFRVLYFVHFPLRVQYYMCLYICTYLSSGIILQETVHVCVLYTYIEMGIAKRTCCCDSCFLPNPLYYVRRSTNQPKPLTLTLIVYFSRQFQCDSIVTNPTLYDITVCSIDTVGTANTPFQQFELQIQGVPTYTYTYI